MPSDLHIIFYAEDLMCGYLSIESCTLCGVFSSAALATNRIKEIMTGSANPGIDSFCPKPKLFEQDFTIDGGAAGTGVGR